MLHTPVKGREEYSDNEKYEVRHWNLDDPRSIRWFIARLNKIRKAHPALQRNESIRFHRVDSNFVENEQLIAYSKVSTDLSDIVVVVVNLDPVNVQAGYLQLPVAEWGLEGSYQAHDLISEARFLWSGEYNYVELRPEMPVHILRIRRRVRDASGFEYYA
jgi:starch synthase (maltosyl-transferring)